MNKVVEVKLISQTEVYNDMGIPTITETKKTAIGNFSTVSGQERIRGGTMRSAR